MFTEQQLDKYTKITISLIVIIILISVGLYFYVYKSPSLGKRSIVDQQIEELQKQVKKNPQDASTRFYLARAYLRNNQEDEAIKELKQVLKLEKDSQQAYFVLGVAYKEKGKSSYSQAGKQFDKVIELSKGKQFSKVNQSLKSSYYFLGEIAFERKQHKKALGYFQKSSEIGSKDSDAMLFIGRCYFRLKDYKNAEKNYKEAIRFVPKFADVYYHLGKMYQAQGKTSEAKQNYNKAIKLKTNYQEAKEALESL
ncbi:MAG: tetratricopeptide repeat protein [Actinobacteria bacterium]|nr:MAG: tetratricopeptide repeat protein [Actinomycetota bacterium]